MTNIKQIKIQSRSIIVAIFILVCSGCTSPIIKKNPDYDCIEPMLVYYDDLSNSPVVDPVAQRKYNELWVRVLGGSNNTFLTLGGETLFIDESYHKHKGYIIYKFDEYPDIYTLKIEDRDAGKCAEFVYDRRYTYVTIYLDQEGESFFALRFSNVLYPH